jgi:hypothetical protein
MYIPLSCDASGDGVITAGLGGTYLLYAVEWIQGDFASGVDATIEVVNRADSVGALAPDYTLLTLTDLSADGFYRPRELEHDNVGVALTTSTLPVVDGDIQVTIADGGVSKAGALNLVLIAI